jgi:hypothetical protein
MRAGAASPTTARITTARLAAVTRLLQLLASAPFVLDPARGFAAFRLGGGVSAVPQSARDWRHSEPKLQ